MARDLKYLRDRVWLSISPETASACGFTSVHELMQFCIGSYHPDATQLFRLNRFFGFA
jgi:hypothetical protein